jgi:hypothetical protein
MGHLGTTSIERPLFTIGHSTHPLEEFLTLLARHEIEALADIRRFPGSRKYPHFSGVRHRRAGLPPRDRGRDNGHALLRGLDDGQSKRRGMVEAIMGAQARLGIRMEHHDEFQAQKEVAEKKKKTTITAESFDRQVAHKMGSFFEGEFLPTMKKLVEAGLS